MDLPFLLQDIGEQANNARWRTLLWGACDTPARQKRRIINNITANRRIKMNKYKEKMVFKGQWLFLILLCCVVMTACMNVRKTETIGEAQVSKERFNNKTIAVLPVKVQTALTTDSLLSLRLAVNGKLDDKLREKLTSSKVIDTKKTADLLNNKGKLTSLDELIKTYDNTGVFDKRIVDSLMSTLGCDYIIFSRLKAEKMAVGFVGKGFGASLEVVMIDKTKKELVWGGSGEFKRGGVFGFGTTENNKAADELIRLAFENF